MNKVLKGLLALSLLAIASLAQGQTLNFTLATSTNDGKTVIPALTWSTSPAATSCTASGTAGSGWTGSKAASGSQALAATSTSAAYSLQCTWPGVTKAVVNWTAPTTNTDNSAYTNPGGYKVYYGTSPSARNTIATINTPATVTWTSPDLTPGTWYFSVTAFNTMGLESDQSNVASKDITAGASKSSQLNLSITIPNAPAMTLQ